MHALWVLLKHAREPELHRKECMDAVALVNDVAEAGEADNAHLHELLSLLGSQLQVSLYREKCTVTQLQDSSQTAVPGRHTKKEKWVDMRRTLQVPDAPKWDHADPATSTHKLHL